MNYLQLVARLHQECGCSGSAPTTVVSQTGEAKRLVDWISLAWREISQEYPSWSWNWLRGTFEIQTVAAQSTYNYTDATAAVTITNANPGVVTLDNHGYFAGQAVTFTTDGVLPTGLATATTYYVLAPTTDTFTLATSVGGTAIDTTGTQSGTHRINPTITQFAQWKPETFRIYLTSAGYGSETKLLYIAYQDWRDVYELGPRIQGRPLHATVKPDRTIGLGPIPNDVYTMSGDYIMTPPELTADTDTPVMPDQFHMAIVYLAMTYYARYEAAPEIYGDAEAKYQNVLRRIAMNQLPELLYPAALV